MQDMLISEFKTHCVKILSEVHDKSESVVVTRRGKPLARIVPLSSAGPGKRQLGAMTGEAEEIGDIVAAPTANDWESIS